MKIVYFGTPRIAAAVLDHLIKNGVEVCAIVTKPDQPRGRGKALACSAIKELAIKQYPTIPVYQPLKASTVELEEELRQFDADLFTFVAYGEIIKQNLLDLPKKGCINLHMSLLPKYRGAAPIQWALLEGAQETGVSVIQMGLKMDAGDILTQEKIDIPPDMQCRELEDTLCHIGKKALLEVLNNFAHFFSKKIPQIEKDATYVQKVSSDMGKIDWKVDAWTIHNQVRALSPHPGAWTVAHLKDGLKRFKILKAQPQDRAQYAEGIDPCLAGYQPGSTASFSKKEWVIACATGALSLLEVQLEGKKPLPIETFLLGVHTPFVFA